MTMWTVSFKSVIPKLHLEHCEDVIVDCERFVGVIDATSGQAPEATRADGISFGREIALIAKSSFEDAKKSASSVSIIQTISERVANHKRLRGLGNIGTGGCFLCVLDRESDFLLRIGDCWCIGDKIKLTSKLRVEDVLSDFRSMHAQAMLLSGMSEHQYAKDKCDSTIIDSYIAVKDNFANIPSKNHEYAFGVINGDFIPEEFIEVHSVKSCSTLAIGTDGYPHPGLSFEQLEQGLAELLKMDPLLIRNFKSPKCGLPPASFDDRSFLSITR